MAYVERNGNVLFEGCVCDIKNLGRYVKNYMSFYPVDVYCAVVYNPNSCIKFSEYLFIKEDVDINNCVYVPYCPKVEIDANEEIIKKYKEYVEISN